LYDRVTPDEETHVWQQQLNTNELASIGYLQFCQVVSSHDDIGWADRENGRDPIVVVSSQFTRVTNDIRQVNPNLCVKFEANAFKFRRQA